MHTVLTCFITWLKVLLKVLVLIIPILFHRVIGIGIGNTFLTFLAWYWYWILQYFLPVLLTTLPKCRPILSLLLRRSDGRSRASN